MHIVVCPKRRSSNLATKAFFAVAFASLIGLSGIMNGMIQAEEADTSQINTVQTVEYR